MSGFDSTLVALHYGKYLQNFCRDTLKLRLERVFEQ